jgi:hypothetical protein
VFTFSLACLIIGCTLITHGSMFGNKVHIGEQDKTSHSKGVHTRSYYIFQTLVLWEVLSCSFQTQMEVWKQLKEA